MYSTTKAWMGFAAGWLVGTVEFGFSASAAGGPFTVLMLPVVAAISSAVYVGAAIVFGLLLRLPGVKAAWQDAGQAALLLAVPPLLVIIFSSPLGLRSIDPESNYSIMSPGLSFLCYVYIVFPFVNLPSSPKPGAA